MKFRTAVMLITALALSGCGADGSGSEREGKAGMDMRQGADRADRILDETLTAIDPSIKWTHGESTQGGCGGSTSGSVTRRRAVMTIISEERRGSFLGVVERHWRKSGYSITGASAHKENPAIFASTPDDFRMSLEFGDKGQAFFDLVTPCLEKSDVSPPKTEPNGPNYAGSDIPYPDQRSDFWSAKAPVAPPAG
ncbi:hypothetical protein [Streptomyces cinnamoneus]|uniref:Lipoprotein n=1 Tax=Streptomyces cinnamoneus TaxID=53446 RepID=A0A918WQ47_STRCJ|nr:hypothetical protein [Streptomyces cinnamoneus]GHC65585.1 hypothetical protein GCM10010507_49060 [Streptomyces cinnamoneus]